MRRQAYSSFFSIAFWAVIAFCTLYLVIWLSLPNVASLVDTPMQAPLQVYTKDHKLIAEFGHKQRIPVDYQDIPKDLIWAVVCTEDQRFFEHGGVDFRGVARAALAVVKAGSKSQGASTITMQVARNFYLTRKKTFTRKIKEVMLAFKIDQVLSKEQILELYCNKVFLGNRSYGIGAAARNYYGKQLHELTLAQMAMIAGLPQAPSRLNPLLNPDLALKRRNHVLSRMLEEEKISQNAYEEAIAAPITAERHNAHITFRAPYLAEHVRRMVQERFGSDGINLGLKVIMTATSQIQRQAQEALEQGLLAYDHRHHYRPARHHVPLVLKRGYWMEGLDGLEPQLGMEPAVVMQVSRHMGWVHLKTGKTQALADKSLQWAMYRTAQGRLRPEPIELSELLHPGDIVWVEHKDDELFLRQIPLVQGALVAMAPQTGAILAMVGGLSEQSGGFNRATQAWRQPGSGFKPFIYASALEAKHLEAPMTLASTIEDNPVVVPMAGEADGLWRPNNDQHKFYGALTLRQSLMRSNNLITVRMLRDLGVDYVHNYIKRFGFEEERHPKSLSLALGSGTVTPLQMTRAYASFANGGVLVEPYLIDKIIDQNGAVIFDHDTLTRPPMRYALSTMQRVMEPSTAFLMDSALKSVIKRGTGRRALALGRRDLAGKTGSTNELLDAWFMGYQPSVAVGVWVGFDDNRPTHEYGARAALPIWVNFMQQALRGKSEQTLPVPEDVIMAWVNKGQENAFVEYFVEGTQPNQDQEEAVQDTASSYERLF